MVGERGERRDGQHVGRTILIFRRESEESGGTDNMLDVQFLYLGGRVRRAEGRTICLTYNSYI